MSNALKFLRSETFGTYWHIEATPDVMIRLKRIFPRVRQSRTGGVATIRATDEVARDLRWMMERWSFEIDDRSRAELDVAADSHIEREQVTANIIAGGQYQLPAGALEPIRDPRGYQLTAADLALARGGLLIADELGLGKTFTGLLTLRDPNALPALVVCPTHLPEQWVGELEKTFPDLNAHVVKKSKPYDPTTMRRPQPMPDVWVINYHKLAGWREHFPGVVKTVIFDEVQELRRSQSAKWKAAAAIADACTYRVGLTATPVYNYGGEVYNIFSVLMPDALGDVEEFMREWGVEIRAGKTGVRDPAALGHWLRNEGLLIRRTRPEVKRELPEVQRIPHTVESDQKKLEELKGDAQELAELILSSADGKERFKAGGQLDWKMRRATGIAKAAYVAAFVEMLLESGEKVVLFGWHRDVYDIWKLYLDEWNPVLYTGSESPTQKRAAKDEFIEGDARLLIMSLRSGAGLDGLQEVCHIAVFGELDWSPGMHDQCIGRLHRDGQDEPVVAYFLISEHGADPLIAETLNVKRMQAEPIRDPDQEVLAQQSADPDRIKRLAASVLDKARSEGRLTAGGS